MESQQKEKQRTSEKERTQNSSTLIFSCVTLGYLPNFSGLCFSHLENEISSNHIYRVVVKIH